MNENITRRSSVFIAISFLLVAKGRQHLTLWCGFEDAGGHPRGQLTLMLSSQNLKKYEMLMRLHQAVHKNYYVSGLGAG